MKRIKCLGLLLVAALLFLVHGSVSATQLGVNVNGAPGMFDFDLLARSQTKWARAFMDVFSFYKGGRNLATDVAFSQFKQVSDAGYKMILSLKNDFKSRQLRLPRPGSSEESSYFGFIEQVLQEYAPYADIIVVGNEPFWETMVADRQYDAAWGGYPIATFYQSLADAICKYLQGHPELGNPKVYLGAFNRLDLPGMQSSGAVQQLLQYAENEKRISGVDLHIHAGNLTDFDENLAYARHYVTKPILSTEFSLVWRYKNHNTERLGTGVAGKAFVEKYGLDPNMQVYQYINSLTARQAPREQWVDFLKSRDWFLPDFVPEVFSRFEKFGVSIGTYAFTTARNLPRSFAPDFNPYILNNLFIPNLAYTANGEVAANYRFLEDFIAMNKGGAAKLVLGEKELSFGLEQESMEVTLPFGTEDPPALKVVQEEGQNGHKGLSFRVTQASSLPGTAKIEIMDQTNALVHTVAVNMRAAMLPDIEVSLGEMQLAADELPILQGAVPLHIAADSPDELIARVDVTLTPSGEEDGGGGSQVLYAGSRLPQNLVMETKSFPDGAYNIAVRLDTTLGSSVDTSGPVVIDNWKKTIDEFLPPIQSSWYPIDQKKTVDESAGWTYETEQPALFFADADRLVRAKASDGYLIWDIPNLRKFSLTLYVKDIAVGQKVQVDVSPAMVNWEEAGSNVQIVESTASGWTKLLLSGDVSPGAYRFIRVTVQESGSSADMLQLGRMELFASRN